MSKEEFSCWRQLHTLSWSNLFAGDRGGRHRKHAQVDGPTTSIDDYDSLRSGLNSCLQAEKI